MPDKENEDVKEIDNALPLPGKKVEDDVSIQNKNFEALSNQLKEVNDSNKKQEGALNTLIGTSDEKFTEILQNLTNLNDVLSVKLKEKDDELKKLSPLRGAFKIQSDTNKKLEEDKKQLQLDKDNLISSLATAQESKKSAEDLLKAEKANSEKRISELTCQIEAKDSLLSENKESLAAKDKEIIDLRNKVESLSNSAGEDSLKKEKLEKRYAEAEDEIKGLKDRIDSLDNEKKDLQSKIVDLNKENKDAIENLTRISAVVNKYENLKMNKLERAYELFSSFKERTRNNLKAVFETDSFLGFISNSMQWERIAGIWEQTKRKIVNDDNEDLAELRELFLILFETYNAGYLDAPYVLINPEINSKYNSNEQLIKNQKSDGNVKEVLLEGYIFKKNNAIHKAMIVVE